MPIPSIEWLRRASCVVLAGVAALSARMLAAQTTDASIMGSVRAADGSALAGAAVTVRNEATGFVLHTRAAADGRFAFVQLPLGGPYAVRAEYPGHGPATRSGYELRLGARVVVPLVLSERATELAPVVVTANAAEARRLERLGGSTPVGAREMHALPAVGRNFTDLAGLAPTVGAALSIGGQRATSTDVRVDGLQARNMLRGGELGRGPYTVSMEAIREFEVVTNVYDVTQGRQGGGALNVATRAGTNTWTGSVFGYGRNDRLGAAHDFLGHDRTDRRYSLVQWGGSVGGPIVRDRLQLFAAFDRQDSREPLFIADLRTPADEVDAGIARDSLARLVDILRRRYGLQGQQTGIFSRAPVANTVFARLDWQAGARHHVTLRDNLSTWNSPDNDVGDQALSLFESRSSIRSLDNQSLLSVRSNLSDEVQNELKLGYSASHRTLTPNSYAPRGFVRIRSALPDGSSGDVRVQFGGNRLAPERSGERQVQLVNTTYWQRGPRLFTLGTDNSLTFLHTYIPVEQGGLFEFESLSDLDALKPSRYSRQVPVGGGGRTARQYVLDAGVFGQAEWRLDDRLTASLGVRYDVTGFLTAAARNPLLESDLGLRTDRTPADWSNVQPRGQVTWDVRGDGADLLRVGAGAFAAQPHYYLQANSIFNSGTDLGDLVLDGAAAPRPDYPAYRQDPSTVPGAPAALAVPAYVNLTGRGFQTPMTWKASAAFQHRFASFLTLGATALWTRTRDNYHYLDRNLRQDPAFTLAGEGGRPVFVPAATIDAKGRTSFRNAVRSADFTHVLELVSNGRLDQRAVVLDGSLGLPRDGQVSASYTFNRTRDNSSFNCCIARTAPLLTPVRGDPRDLSGAYGAADTDFRHKLVVFATLPKVKGFQLGARYVGSTGRPFSLTVNGDINGDDYNGNDLAFIFDPDDPATPPAVAASMRRVLANPSNVARGYIRRNLGRVAGRNATFAPWVWRVDARLSRALPKLAGRSAEVVMDVYNVANLLNSSWGGQYLLPAGISASNPVTQRLTLLNVVGFDQATRGYRYTVNENVGVLRKQGDPYQIQLGLRYAL
jgi:hypothetical protein